MYNMFFISIIIPVYKAHDYIERCLDSIISQTCEDITIECILVNDFTPDDSMEIVKEKIKDYDKKIKFKIINHSENKGASAARNSGIKVAEGDFLLFVDSDDYLEVEALQAFTNELSKIRNQEDVDIVIGNTYLYKSKTTAMENNICESLLIDNLRGDALRKLLSRDVIHLVCNKLIRRKYLLNNHLYFEEGIICEDILWSYLIFYHAQYVLLMPHITYVYFDNPQSVTNTLRERVVQIIFSRIVICEKILQLPPEGKMMIEYYAYIFFILHRAVDLFERNKCSAAHLKNRLYSLRNLFLKEVWKKNYFLSFLFFLTLIKPFYYVSHLKWYRRYFDRLYKFDISLNHISPFRH